MFGFGFASIRQWQIHLLFNKSKELQNGNKRYFNATFYDFDLSREIVVFIRHHDSFGFESQMMFDYKLPIHFLIENNLHLNRIQLCRWNCEIGVKSCLDAKCSLYICLSSFGAFNEIKRLNCTVMARSKWA